VQRVAYVRTRSEFRANRSFDRWMAVARPILLLVIMMEILLRSPSPFEKSLLAVVILYVILSLRQASLPLREWPVPKLETDMGLLLLLLLATQSIEAFWFYYLYVMLSAGGRYGWRTAWKIALVFSALVLLAMSAYRPRGLQTYIRAAALAMGTMTVGSAASYLGESGWKHVEQEEFIEDVSGLLQYETGLSESIRQTMNQLGMEFGAANSCVAIIDADLDRIFVWKVGTGQPSRITPEVFPLSEAETFLLDKLDYNALWNSLGDPVRGFAWDRELAKLLADLPPVPKGLQEALGAHSLSAVAFTPHGGPDGRIILANLHRWSSPADLRQMENIVRRVEQPLANLFRVRHLRSRTIESERTRIAHDLHDGILQTLLSVNIQLDVLRHQVDGDPERVATSLADLERTLKRETDDFRRMVQDLRPLRVGSADLPDLMTGFAERFQRESAIQVDLFLENGDMGAPDRICREIFQIYREALSNIKKHARASHVVVKLMQDDVKVLLVIDDNGQGFSFSGRYTIGELDELRLGPISIKERIRSMGGKMTIESSPKHGARLTAEIPLT
jgi:signal transduction histidine kinase